MEQRLAIRVGLVVVLVLILCISAYRFQDAREIHAELHALEMSLPQSSQSGVNTEELKINLSATITKTNAEDEAEKEVEDGEEEEDEDIDVSEIMKNRLIYRQRACSLRRKIQNLVTARDFEGMLQLHHLIYDLAAPMPDDDDEPATCNTPSYVMPEQSQAKYDQRRKKAHIDIFHEDKLNLTICLPPKCGTTNWQYALTTLNDGPNGRGLIPSLDPEHFKQFDKGEHELFVLNTRHPFERLLSAWRDKFLLIHSPKRQNYFLPSIRHFERQEYIPTGWSSSFEAFAQFRAANPSDFVHNRHWRTITNLCNPCHFTYDLILHLETISAEYDYAWETIGVDPPRMREQYKSSPLKRHDRTWYWRHIPKAAIKELYTIYYMDFVALGYGPEEFEPFLAAGSAEAEWPDELIQKARNASKFHDQEKLNEICYR